MHIATLKHALAEAVIQFIEDDMVLGIGTGTTVEHFIPILAKQKHRIQGAIPSSYRTEKVLKTFSIPILDFHHHNTIDLYIDGADAFNAQKQLIKGAGGALTHEKILAYSAKKFICLVDESKPNQLLNNTPVPIEVLTLARSCVGRELIQLGGQPNYRQGFITDNHNIIIDLHNIDLTDPLSMEITLKSITGVVESGLFTKRTADTILLATTKGMQRID